MSQSPLIPEGFNPETEVFALALLLSMQQLEVILHLHRSRIYGLIRTGDFPRPKKIGRTARWVRSEVDQWVAQLAAQQPEQTGGEA
jgi:prophage regulatory protein